MYFLLKWSILQFSSFFGEFVHGFVRRQLYVSLNPKGACRPVSAAIFKVLGAQLAHVLNTECP